MKTQWIPADSSEPIEEHECEDQFFFHDDSMVGATRKDVKDYLGGDFEFVTVLYDDKPRYMLVNEIGSLIPLPINNRATEIYHNASRAQGRDWVGAPYIHGPAILVEEELT